jgi:serine/threonine protein kinase
LSPDQTTDQDQTSGQQAIQRGTVVDGKYEIVGKLGAGGVGVVYDARHRGLDRRVALKLLKSSAAEQDPEFRARFTREARVMSRLEHPHAVTVYDYGDHHGALYIAMEHLTGHALEDEVADAPLEIFRVINIAAQLCDVLTVTHEMDLVHRDIKPDNIFITETDHGPHATLVDFGLAFIATDKDLSRITQAGTVAGTPQFLSPEQAQASEIIGPASDIYSLGCVIYELLIGSPVVEGGPVLEMLNAHVFVPATSMRVEAPDSAIPASVDTFVLSMLSKTPEDRPTAFEAATFFRKMLASDDVRGRGRPAGLLEPRSRRALTSSNATEDSDGSSVQDTLDQPGESGTRRLGVRGDISRELVSAARAAGWQPLPYSANQSLDVVVVMAGESIDRELTGRHPTIAVVGSDSISDAVDLLKIGVEDVVADADPHEIIRKAHRLYRSHQRRLSQHQQSQER